MIPEQRTGHLPLAAPADLSAYRSDPALFCRKFLSTTLYPKQLEILEAVRDQNRVSVRSCHGVGKTTAAAACLLWWVFTHRPSLALTTAPTNRQVEGLLWREVRQMWARMPLDNKGRMLSVELKLSDNQYAVGLSTNEPERFAGWHSENLLAIVDEASGVGEEIYEPLMGTLTGAHCHALLIGNPIRAEGTFHRSHQTGRWWAMRLGYEDTPNFAPGASEVNPPFPSLVTKQWVDSRREDWGEDSLPFRTRVMAEFPLSDSSVLIPLELLELALTRTPVASEPVVLGLDVARYGDAETVMALRHGDQITEIQAWAQASLTETAARALDAIVRTGATDIVIDAVGLGAGVVDQLRSQLRVHASATKVHAFEGHARTRMPYCVNRRDAAYLLFSQRLRDGTLTLAKRWERLFSQASKLRYGLDQHGNIQVETKEQLRRRGFASPDWLDAVAMTLPLTLRRFAPPTDRRRPRQPIASIVPLLGEGGKFRR